jgi:hypothetical protein
VALPALPETAQAEHNVVVRLNKLLETDFIEQLSFFYEMSVVCRVHISICMRDRKFVLIQSGMTIL